MELEDMTVPELAQRLTELRGRMALLEQLEPEDMDSEEYFTWAERHAELEDQADDILDLLDELDAEEGLE